MARTKQNPEAEAVPAPSEQVSGDRVEHAGEAESKPGKVELLLEALNRRFDDIDRRFEEMDSRFNEGMSNRPSPREREQEQTARSRAKDDTLRMERKDIQGYAPPAVLETPESEQYTYRWVREFVNGFQTPRDVQMRLREGYERVLIEDLPEDFVVDEDAAGDGVARTTGLILMRIPKEKERARSAYFQRQSRERLEAADELQGIGGNLKPVREDRGSRVIDGSMADAALRQSMSQT